MSLINEAFAQGRPNLLSTDACKEIYQLMRIYRRVLT